MVPTTMAARRSAGRTPRARASARATARTSPRPRRTMSAPERLRFGGIGSENRQPNACEGQQSCERHASHLFLAPRKGLVIDFGVRSYRQNIATVACNSRNCVDFFDHGVCEIGTR